MSKPAQRSTTTSIVPPPSRQQPTSCPAGPSTSTKLTFVLEATIRGAEKAPAQFRYRACRTRRTRAWPSSAHFHASWRSQALGFREVHDIPRTRVRYLGDTVPPPGRHPLRYLPDTAGCLKSVLRDLWLVGLRVPPPKEVARARGVGDVGAAPQGSARGDGRGNGHRRRPPLRRGPPDPA